MQIPEVLVSTLRGTTVIKNAFGRLIILHDFKDTVTPIPFDKNTEVMEKISNINSLLIQLDQYLLNIERDQTMV